MEITNSLENLIKHLDKSNIEYAYKSNTCVIFLPSKLSIKISYDEKGRIEITNRLLKYNFLTGIIEMSLSSAVKYNTIGLFIISLYYLLTNALLLVELPTGFFMAPVGFFIAFAVIIIINFLYYISEFYYYKSRITSILGCI